jgi:hypothetical protein
MHNAAGCERSQDDRPKMVGILLHCFTMSNNQLNQIDFPNRERCGGFLQDRSARQGPAE